MTFLNSTNSGYIVGGAGLFTVAAILYMAYDTTGKKLREKNITILEAASAIINPYTNSKSKSASPISWEINPDKASGSKKKRKTKRRK
jgi:hypothetical protein